MIECINSILDLIIKLSIVGGLIFVYTQYSRVKILDKRIEEKHKEHQEKMKTDSSIIYNLDRKSRKVELEEEKATDIGPLERERSSILSTLPFLK